MERKVIKRSVRLTPIDNPGNTLRPFWNQSCSIFSSNFSRPPSLGEEKHDLNSKVENTPRKSWFSIKTFLNTRGNSVKISSEEISNLAPGGNQELTRSTKIKLNPSKIWLGTLNRWFGTSRWTYNRCLSLFKEGKCKISKKISGRR